MNNTIFHIRPRQSKLNKVHLVIKETNFRLGLFVRLFGVNMKEDWQKIRNNPHYEVSDHGRVRSWKNGAHGIGNKYRIIKQQSKANGYYKIVSLQVNKKSKPFFVHKLVLENFICLAPTDKHQCAHNDGNSTNNHVSNLRWATPKENQLDRIKHGTSVIGEGNGRAILDESQVINMRILYKNGVSITALSRAYKVSHGCAYGAIKGKNWKHLNDL